MAVIKKIGISINAYDASELLYDALSQIRDQVDGIYAVWQKKSYCGNPMDEVDMNELQRLKSIGLIDDLIEFKPNYTQYAREQETEKRNMSIDFLKSKGYSHVLNVDSDEIYDKDQFKYAKDLINKKGYPITYCTYLNYFRDLSHYLVYPFVPYVNFIHSTFFKYTYNCAGPGLPTDPTRRIHNPSNLGTYIFKPEEVRMNHLSWVRKDIRKKLNNWSAKDNFKDELIDKAVEVYENWKEGDDATLLFNVPGNSVYVRKLEKRLCDVKIPWVEEQMEEWKKKNSYL